MIAASLRRPAPGLVLAAALLPATPAAALTMTCSFETIGTIQENAPAPTGFFSTQTLVGGALSSTGAVSPPVPLGPVQVAVQMQASEDATSIDGTPEIEATYRIEGTLGFQAGATDPRATVGVIFDFAAETGAGVEAGAAEGVASLTFGGPFAALSREARTDESGVISPDLSGEVIELSLTLGPGETGQVAFALEATGAVDGAGFAFGDATLNIVLASYRPAPPAAPLPAAAGLLPAGLLLIGVLGRGRRRMG